MTGSSQVVLLALLAVGATVEVKPIEKVISLIEGLKKEVEDEGKAEASSYDKFACFCKDTTEKKSESVNKGHDSIKMLSADIADKTQSRVDDISELAKRKDNQEKLSKELDETIARCAKEKAEYEAEAADLSKAISSLKSAIKAMKDSKSSASLLALTSVVKTVSSGAAMVKTPFSLQNAVASLLQQKVDPNDPEYEFHSGDIISLCEQLLEDFQGQKKDLDTEWGKTDKACKETKASLKKEMKSNKQAMEELEKEIEKLAKEIAEHREDLVESEGDLKDDEQYLKDLTARCEDRANDYDQRSQMRSDELGALTSALDILSNRVSDADEVNKRAFIQNVSTPVKANTAETKTSSTKVAPKAPEKKLSFLQDSMVKSRAHNFLATRTDEARKDEALDVLRQEGRRLGSVTISMLAVRVAADPFKKVKGLIQKLIERLLEESKAEATKKGFCDTSLANAEHDRDARFQDALDLNMETRKLEAKEDELEEEIDYLTKSLKEERAELKKATEDREDEKKINMESLKTAKEGHEAVTEALLVLKSFYKQAAKASLLQASPVDEDTDGAGFSGSYKGKQGGMKAVFALLETIQSDFDRTLRKTEESEEKAHREYVKYSQDSKASIGGKETKKELDEQDLKTTQTSIKKNMADLKANTDLLDDALQEIEALKPECIDTGMSYKERVEKREEEIKALEKALEILAPP